MSSRLSTAGLILVLVVVFIGLGLLLQLFYVLWYRRHFRRRSAADSEFASIISDRSGTPPSKELALYYLYYRNSPSAFSDNNAEAASTSQPTWVSAPAVGAAAVEAMQEPPVPEEAASPATDDEDEKDPESMMCPSFSVMVRDFAEEDEMGERTASAPAAPGGGARSTLRKDHGRLDASSSTSPPFGSPAATPVHDAVEIKRYAGKAAPRRVALPS